MSTAKQRASVHARRSWKCPLCSVVVFGNGGRTSHQRKHMRNAGVHPETIEIAGHRHAWAMFYAAQKDGGP